MYRGDSNEYTQNNIIFIEYWKDIPGLNYPHFPPDLALWLTHVWNIFMAPKIFEPLMYLLLLPVVYVKQWVIVQEHLS